MNIRKVKLDDLPIIAEMMHNALEPFYGGNHRTHASRIVETATRGTEDTKGHFSAAQLMYVAEDDGQVVGVLNFVVKYQGTLKISPLIVSENARGKGISRLLLEQVNLYAEKYRVRQIYCTVSAKNNVALGYFLAHGFVRAGMANKHYRADTDEVMLYKITGHDEIHTEERTISVLPLTEIDKEQVREMVIRRLSPYFDGVDDRWVDSLFAGYERRGSRDPNEKYKLIWVAKTPDGQVLGVAGATPKKGEPVKLMPLVTDDIQAFLALVAELPSFLREYGHKLYTHVVPSSIEVETFQHHGWSVEAMMPEAYKREVVTQQWGIVLEEKVMKTIRVKQQYFDAIMAGTKPLEVRVGYASILKVQKNDSIRMECGRASGIVQVADIRVYKTFAEMLQNEKAGHVVPSDPTRALEILRNIYPSEKERLGVYVLELKVVKSVTGK